MTKTRVYQEIRKIKVVERILDFDKWHVSDDTTRIYIHAFDEERHADMEKLTLKMEFTRGRIE